MPEVNDRELLERTSQIARDAVNKIEQGLDILDSTNLQPGNPERFMKLLKNILSAVSRLQIPNMYSVNFNYPNSNTKVLFVIVNAVC